MQHPEGYNNQSGIAYSIPEGYDNQSGAAMQHPISSGWVLFCYSLPAIYHPLLHVLNPLKSPGTETDDLLRPFCQ